MNSKRKPTAIVDVYDSTNRGAKSPGSRSLWTTREAQRGYQCRYRRLYLANCFRTPCDLSFVRLPKRCWKWNKHLKGYSGTIRN